MRAELTITIVLSTLASPTLATPAMTPSAAAQASGAPAASADTQPFSPAMAGTWRSAADPVRLASDFDRSVWGDNAARVRTTELVVDQSGTARLTVTRTVVNGQGQPIAASTSVEQVHLVIGDARRGAATRMEHDVTVTGAERRYPDDPESKWTLDGVGVQVVTFADGDGDTLEVRFDTPEGRGSFWELLHRTTGSTSSRASR
jgi:hypothetical protein